MTTAIDNLRATNERLESILKSFPKQDEVEVTNINFGELSLRDYCRAARDSSMRAKFWIGFLVGVAFYGATSLLWEILS